MKLKNNMWLPDGDTFFQSRGEYEITDYNIVKPHWKQTRTAVDIGAHCGYWTKRLVVDFDRVIAFEPMPEHYECLKQNVTSTNCDLLNLGLSKQPGKLYMEQHIENSGMSRIVDHPTDVCVVVDTLDNCLDSDIHIDFIKIDAENHESFVLQGAINTLIKCKPTLFVEILDPQDRRIHHILEPLGYVCVMQYERNFIWTNINDI